jgi:hypothetical protein
MWEKVVLNLLSNAFKFTFDGEIAVDVCRGRRRGRAAVRDSGIGIAAAEIPRLFERFHRVENARARTHEGSGIGLALVQELVKLPRRRRSRPESALGRGTTFTVRCPGPGHLPADQVGGSRSLDSAGRRAGRSSRRPAVAPDRAGTTPAPSCGRYEALPVPASRRSARTTAARWSWWPTTTRTCGSTSRGLLAERYRVEAVADGEAALAAARRRPPTWSSPT